MNNISITSFLMLMVGSCAGFKFPSNAQGIHRKWCRAIIFHWYQPQCLLSTLLTLCQSSHSELLVVKLQNFVLVNFKKRSTLGLKPSECVAVNCIHCQGSCITNHVNPSLSITCPSWKKMNNFILLYYMSFFSYYWFLFNTIFVA